MTDVPDKIPSFEEPRPKFSCPNLFNSSHTLQSDSYDLSETFMHNLEERCSDFQSVNSISKNLTDVTDSSEFRYPYVVLLCMFLAISLTVLFQITKVCSLLEWSFIISIAVSSDHSQLRCTGFAGSR